MKKLSLSLILALAVIAASSQKVYFFYIQTEGDQPFYVKMDKKIQYSNPHGYLILPKLHDSSYNITIGSPQNKWAEQSFAVNVSKRDHGYILKNIPEKGWGLFDLQSLDLLMASTTEQKKSETGTVTAFTEILSKAADDPSLKEKTVQAKPEEKKPEEVVAEVTKTDPDPVQNSVAVTDNIEKSSKKSKRKSREENNDSSVVEPAPQQAAVNEGENKTEKKSGRKAKNSEEEKAKNETLPEIKTNEPVKEEPKTGSNEVKSVAKEEPTVVKEETKPVINNDAKTERKEDTKAAPVADYRKSEVKRYSESSTTEGLGLVFVDQYQNGNKDTIKLVIPNPKPVVTTLPESPKEEKKFLDINTVPATKTVTEQVKEEQPAVNKTEPVVTPKEEKKTEKKAETRPVVKTNYSNACSEAASESDFTKLHRKMKTVNDDEDKMIGEARKYFKSTCFSTEQVKQLSSLFFNDEARYNFFDLAYKYVIDADNFSSLQSEIKDPYYLSRFKAMLRN